MSFRFLDHTADVQVECRAHDFPSLLEAAVDALYAVCLARRRTDTGVSHSIELTVYGDGTVDLYEETLIRWLQEMIYLVEKEGFVASRLALRWIEDDARLVADLDGYLCTPEERAEEVKSATYHDLAVWRREGDWGARVLFDL